MKRLTIVFAILTLVAILFTACGHAANEFSKQSKCVLSGDGCNGETGPQGLQGPQGANGAAATVVPLCPGVSNYGVFVEVALCLNDSLYAVYSANGGFLTLLAPGNYSSNAIGSACNLTVAAHCKVSH